MTRDEIFEKLKDSVGEDYLMARELGLTSKNRLEEGNSHHPLSVRMMLFLSSHDFLDYDNYFCWKSGGDGDNGEALMYQMDAFFELMEHINQFVDDDENLSEM